MEKLQLNIIRRARKEFKKIYPCSSKQSFSECFTWHEDHVLFWFNTEDQSTHVMAFEVPEPENVSK